MLILIYIYAKMDSNMQFYNFIDSNYDVISDSMAIHKGGQNCPITSFTLHFY